MEKKKVLIISPQQWNFLFISKQHYAVELSKKYEVYYISFPIESMGRGFTVTREDYSGRVNIIRHKVPLPHRFMYRVKWWYRKRNTKVMQRILNTITGGEPFELAIDFGLFFLYDGMTWVNARKKIFFPVDDSVELPPLYPGADLVLSVSPNVIEKFRQHNVAAQFIHHGLSAEYAAYAEKKLAEGITKTGYKASPAVGYIGNLDNEFVDRELLLQLASTFPQCHFHCYGLVPAAAKQKSDPFWKQIVALPNVTLHGQQSPDVLAKKMQDLDIFLLCYKPDYKRYHAENSHKIMEYLSTGKPVVSTNISVFEGTGLLYMSPKDKNGELTGIFKYVLEHPNETTAPELAEKRMRFALQHTYAQHTRQILALAGITDTE